MAGTYCKRHQLNPEVEIVAVNDVGEAGPSIVDAPLTLMIGERSGNVVSWYYNEWGFSCRMVDLITYLAERM